MSDLEGVCYVQECGRHLSSETTRTLCLKLIALRSFCHGVVLITYLVDLVFAGDKIWLGRQEYFLFWQWSIKYFRRVRVDSLIPDTASAELFNSFKAISCPSQACSKLLSSSFTAVPLFFTPLLLEICVCWLEFLIVAETPKLLGEDFISLERDVWSNLIRFME